MVSEMKRTYNTKTNEHMDEEELNFNHPLKEGLPYQAYAIAPDINDPRTWLLPHHSKSVNRAVKGKIGYEHTVDWEKLSECVQLLSGRGIEGRRVQADAHLIIAGAKHLALHCIKAGMPLPNALAVLV